MSEKQSKPETPSIPLVRGKLVSSPDKGRLGGVEVFTCELCNQDGGEVIFRNVFLRVALVDDADYPGFCRVICNAHIAEMTDLAIPQRSTMMMTVCKVEQALREVLQPDKINLASLGNMTPHLHWHVIPRFKHDKHFPQPIWGVAQREWKSSLPLDWKAHLAKNISSQLTTTAAPAYQ